MARCRNSIPARVCRQKGVERAAHALEDLDRYIGDLWLDQVHNDRLQRYRVARRVWAVGTLTRTLAVVRRILELSAELWRDEQSGLTWLAVAPMINLGSKYKKRQPYPLDWDEQASFVPELAGYLQRMALFAVNAGTRQEEICGLKWLWEQRVPELDTPAIQRTVFVLPGSVTKCQVSGNRSIFSTGRHQEPESDWDGPSRHCWYVAKQRRWFRFRRRC